jgi:hypothetical protein
LILGPRVAAYLCSDEMKKPRLEFCACGLLCVQSFKRTLMRGAVSPQFFTHSGPVLNRNAVMNRR